MSTARTKGTGMPPSWLMPAFGGCVFIGVAALAYGLFGAGDELLGWQAMHIAYMYILGPTFAGVLISVIWELTSSKWGQNMKRFSESSIGVIPVLLLGFVGLAAGHHHLMHAGHHGHELVGGKIVWLDPTFLIVRDALALVLLSVLSVFFIKHQLRPSLGVAINNGAPIKSNPLASWITSGYTEYSRELARSTRIRQILAPILAFSYAIVLTLFAFDNIMSLDPIWISTLFGAYYFITSLFMGLCFLAVMSVLHRRVAHTTSPHGVAGKRITPDNLHDLGKLLFAFCMLSADFFWSQFVVIWYANIPEETPFIIRRIRLEPWNDLALTVLILGYAIPFTLLIFKRLKKTDITLGAITGLVLVMMVFERILLIAPSLWHDTEGPHGAPFALTVITTFGVVIGFIGLAGFGYRYVLGVFIHAPPEKDLSDKGELIEGSADEHHHGSVDDTDGDEDGADESSVVVADEPEASETDDESGEDASEDDDESGEDASEDDDESDKDESEASEEDEADDEGDLSDSGDDSEEDDVDEKEKRRRKGEEGDDE